ncbi:hypothetical protein FHX40_0859 [Thermopolyspora flexuosa]|uniref:Uncharacterized protein n=1 Tax=Thermopolyspora flexuosa TaxID=103836 RepID=A0A543IUE8_9ACTN|nr:hypothetical protein FHX40_0859 [Thermopolyspora flexuosa]
MVERDSTVPQSLGYAVGGLARPIEAVVARAATGGRSSCRGGGSPWRTGVRVPSSCPPPMSRARGEIRSPADIRHRRVRPGPRARAETRACGRGAPVPRPRGMTWNAVPARGRVAFRDPATCVLRSCRRGRPRSHPLPSTRAPVRPQGIAFASLAGLGVRPLAVVATAGRMRSTVRATPVITAVRTGKASDRDRDGAWPVHAERFHQTARFPASVRLPACLVQGAHALPGRSPDGFGHRPGIGGPGLPYITSKTLGAIGGKWPPVTGGVISMPRRPVFRSDRRGRRDPFPSPFLPILCRRTARRWPPGTASRCFRRCHGHARPNPLSRTSPIWGKGVAVAETDRP